MEFDNQQIGGAFREAFRDFEQKPDPGVWKGLSRQLLIRKILRVSYTWVAPALVVAFAVGWFFYSTTDNKPAEPVRSKQAVVSSASQKPDDIPTGNQTQAVSVVNEQQSEIEKDKPVKTTSPQNADSKQDEHIAKPVTRTVSKPEARPAVQQTSPAPASSHPEQSDITPVLSQSTGKEIVKEKPVTHNQASTEVEKKPAEVNEPEQQPVITETTYFVCAGEEVSLTAPEGWRYTWSTGDFARNITVKPDETTSYEVTVEDRDGKPGITRFIVNILDCSIFVPRAFSPNNDGSNDLFLVRGEGITQFEMKVYSKWGELVFETRDIFQGWDGYLRGSRAPVDAYIYQIRFTDEAGNWHNVQGSVALVP